jgi:hypothetical protein
MPNLGWCPESSDWRPLRACGAWCPSLILDLVDVAMARSFFRATSDSCIKL